MAPGNSGGPASGWLSIIPVSRTTFSSWPTQDTAAIPPDPPTGIAAVIIQQTSSFRTYWAQIRDETAIVGFLTQAAAAAPFDPSTSGPPWTYWLRTTQRDLRPRFSEDPPPWVPVPIFDPQLWPGVLGVWGMRDLRRDQKPRFSEQPTPWVPVPIFDPQLWPATQVQGGRIPARAWRDVTQPQPIWNFPPELWPATQIGGDRLAARRWRTVDQPQDGWLFSAQPPAFDPALYVATQLLGGRMPGRGWWTSTPIPDAWIYTSVPAFDPALWPATQLFGGLMSGRPWRTVTQPQDAWIYSAFSDPTLFLSPTDQEWRGERVRARGGKPSVAIQDAWIYSAFSDPALYAATTDQEWRGERARPRISLIPAWALQDGWLQSAIPFAPIVQQVTLSDRLRRGQRWFDVNQPDLAWIYVNLPAIDPALLPAMFELMSSFRLRSGQVWFSADPLPPGWIFANLPPVVTLTGGVYIPIFRPRRR